MAHQSRVMLPSDRRAGDAAGFVPEVQERDARRERAPRARKTPVDGDNLSSPEKRKSSIRALAGQHPYLVAGLLALLAGLIILGIIWWLDARRFESTDDAFIDAHSVQISAQVSGAIVDIPVTDNQLVAAGAVLAKLDDRDYRAALAQAKGQVDQANANIENLGAQIEAQQARVDQAQKQVNEAQAAFKFAEEEDDRAQDLLRKGAGTAQRAQQTASDLRQRQAALAAARANYIAAEKQIPGPKNAAGRERRAIGAGARRAGPGSGKPCSHDNPGAAERTNDEDVGGQGRLCAARTGAHDVRPAGPLDHRKFQGDAAHLHASAPTGFDHHRRLSRPRLSRTR